jgi:hypothetical protein
MPPRWLGLRVPRTVVKPADLEIPYTGETAIKRPSEGAIASGQLKASNSQLPRSFGLMTSL